MNEPTTRYGLIRRRIRSLEQAHQFLRDLFDMGLLFHPEDSPDSVTDPLGDYLFTQDESDLLAQRIGEVYDFDQDPCAFCLKLKTSLERPDEPEPLKQFTVLLARPDNISNGPSDTYLAHVTEENAQRAMWDAQREAWRADNDIEGTEETPVDTPGHPTDYHVLFVTTGHLRDLSRDSE